MTATFPSKARPSSTIALMYHALDGPGNPASGQDPHYCVSSARFDAHLDLLRRTCGGGASARDRLAGSSSKCAILTFDDGHLSNFTLALPLLVKHDARADFFVNPARVGSPGFASWPQLSQMAAAGMSIQSHGWSHRYFTELTPAQLREDLTHSRSTIEDRIGQAVTLLAPPGGRVPTRLVDIARECGYTHVLGSQPGCIEGMGKTLLPRMAVTANVDIANLHDWLEGRGIGRARLRYAALGLAKRALGTHAYERLRERLLGHVRSDA